MNDETAQGVSPELEQVYPQLADWDERTLDEHWALVGELVATHGDDIRRAAIAWCSSAAPTAQCVGLDVLGVLGVDDEVARDGLVSAASHLLASPSADVRWSLAVALGRNSTDGRTTPGLLRLAADADDDVRFQAVAGLSVSADDEPEVGGPVVDALMRAMSDPSAEIRDWATFGLGVQREVDTEEIRAALRTRLQDDEADTAGEAAVALAKRGDSAVAPVILERLGTPDVGNLWLEAAAELGDPVLLPRLRDLERQGWQIDDPRPELLGDAIAACSRSRPLLSPGQGQPRGQSTEPDGTAPSTTDQR